ncbi:MULTISPECIES: acetyl/propionyl/methylcrotonyl-CoA carboxylase subunit alpha [unclassified Novosphingobium]|uniref:acetyl/propionyl/methylcrotonyl-CoA carboxylase subunit alpha n=1 Tax=unclassified Novosphingobium TaxID=2644732 RepID=UPI00146D1D9C|nr:MULTISPECIES: acetyl/propionyl/methylcrotonyl-CoA carboxylase subunit alpha [unclassified Novosphingobium]NMN05250.1 3-methylcrotonyl-CoA carboxylase alpha subunit [Novosphingobium sp. SG919]NMN87545.1 3-methylcrotonyl-CoA carboxylase alpha subunit [Novosphingobium sp. SG916]
MLESILIANRGEIACRIIRTAKRLGLRTVAVYSEADAQAMHVAQADQAVAIGAAPPRESYLVGERIIAAALETGAQAVHPGYGFLSENAEFAQAVIDAGLVWIGPPPSAISAMGLKDAAKALMQQAGVPTTPGYLGENQDADWLAQEAAKVGYPVLIKAVAGGGGKGMRLVEQAADFADALASCQREAAAAFGNAHVLIEKYILSPRHIEVQVFGDAHGNVVHLFERDCSLQRRHQKVIEEAPAPGMDEATRAAVCQAAVRAAQAVGYQGAGTVEFIADGSEGLRADRIWFMEMNTRLQVEHPVTEAITGVDLVEWQIRVASGEPLPRTQQDLSINGWAMEARLYAEDPAKGFLPSIGRLDHLHFGMGEGGRIDTGVAQGDTITPFYDPMIAKVIAQGPTRDDARRRLSAMLDQTAVWPVRTNAAFLTRALAHPQFVAGTVDTGVIGRDGAKMAQAVAPSPAALARAAARLVAPSLAPGLRLNSPPRRTARFLLDGAAIDVALDRPASGPARSTLVCEGGQAWLLEPWHHKASDAASAGDGAILAPMPGRVIAVSVAQGEVVAKGQKLLTLEAMKMEHTLLAPFDGVVAALETQAGAQVQVDALLARIVQKED